MSHISVALIAQYLNVRQRKFCTIIIQTVHILSYPILSIIKLQFFLLSIYLYMAFDIFTISYPPHTPHPYWDFTRNKQGEKKEYTPFLPESKYELSIRGLAS